MLALDVDEDLVGEPHWGEVGVVTISGAEGDVDIAAQDARRCASGAPTFDRVELTVAAGVMCGVGCVGMGCSGGFLKAETT